MARRPVTRELYAKLLAGFRDAPGNATHAARVADCERRMAKRGWEEGWPVYPWAEPIRKVVEREKLEAAEKARAEEVERARQAAKLKDDARGDALEAHKQEGQLVKAARINVIVQLNALGRIGPSLQVLSEQIRQAIDTGQVPWDEASVLLRNLATAAAQVVRVGHTVLQIERLHRGEPTDILGITPVEMSNDEALQEIADAAEDAQRFRRKGLTVIAGGEGNATGEQA